MKRPVFFKLSRSATEAVLDRCMMHTCGMDEVATVSDGEEFITYGYGIPYDPRLPLTLLK